MMNRSRAAEIIVQLQGMHNEAVPQGLSVLPIIPAFEHLEKSHGEFTGELRGTDARRRLHGGTEDRSMVVGENGGERAVDKAVRGDSVERARLASGKTGAREMGGEAGGTGEAGRQGGRAGDLARWVGGTRRSLPLEHVVEVERVGTYCSIEPAVAKACH
jgi:hypothetical protein